MTYARSVFVVHNIAHQGRGPMAELAPLEVPGAYSYFFRLDDPIGGVHMNVMKAGLMAAHRVIAVSHGCALPPRRRPPLPVGPLLCCCLQAFKRLRPGGGRIRAGSRAVGACADGWPAGWRRYAWECQTAEGGWGLDGVLREGAWKLRGIVNGIDTREWSPARDVFLQGDGYANYSAADLREGKARCKAALQRVRSARCCLRSPSTPRMEKQGSLPDL